jgi:hypothetical protein
MVTTANKQIRTSIFPTLATKVKQLTYLLSSTSRLSPFVILLSPIVGYSKVPFWGQPEWHKAHIKFHPNPSSGSRVESRGQTDGGTDKTSP